MYNLNVVWEFEIDVCLYIFFKMYFSDNYCLCVLYVMLIVMEDLKENGEIIVKFFFCIYWYEIFGLFKLVIVYRCKMLIF